MQKTITWKKQNDDLVSVDNRFKIVKTYSRTWPFACIDTVTGRRERFDYQWQAKDHAELILFRLTNPSSMI
jgi:hypothetical protein